MKQFKKLEVIQGYTENYTGLYFNAWKATCYVPLPQRSRLHLELKCQSANICNWAVWKDFKIIWHNPFVYQDDKLCPYVKGQGHTCCFCVCM